MQEYDKQQILSHIQPEVIISTLSPFILGPRKKTIENSLSKRLSSIQLAIENPGIIHNALATLRSCEGLGLSAAHIISEPAANNLSHNITEGSAEWIQVHYHKTLNNFLVEQPNVLLIGAATTAPTSLHEVPVDKPLCIILGNEQNGLSKECLKQVNMTYTIPMHGMIDSFNLSVSAGISLYDITKRRRQYIQRQGDLTPPQTQWLRAKYYLNSVNARLINRIFQPYLN